MSEDKNAYMYGLGVLKTLGLAFRHFLETYLDDFRHRGKRYNTAEGIAYRSSKEVSGIFTVQYPEEKLPVPEEFRYIPFLVYVENDGVKEYRCTSCGICAKVCPPQCIWIVRSTDPNTGRPIPDPAEFYIDIDICMNCGYCSEYCPFDAIKMDHDYEISTYSRKANVYDKEKLGKPLSYYASIRPVNYEREEAAIREAETRARSPKIACLTWHLMAFRVSGSTIMVQSSEIDLLFPSRAIEPLRKLRGEVWENLVSRLVNLDPVDPERVAFVLFMVRIGSCTTCQSDSYRAMRGCILCSTNTIKRYKGSDQNLVDLYNDALKDVSKYMKEV